MNIRRGDIFFAELYEQSGSIQKGERPVIVISNNAANKHSSVISVVPITSKKKKRLPTHVHISGFGLREHGTILGEQILSIETSQLINYVNSIANTVYLKKLDDALKVQLGL